MKTSEWIKENYTHLSLTTKQIIKDDENVDDFFHFILEQMLSKPAKIDKLTDKEKMYFFVRIVKNNYYSKTSPYHYRIRRESQKSDEWDDKYHEIPDEDYDDNLPDMEWVRQQLYSMDWFSRDLFLLWLELGTFTQVSKQTTIPLNSVGNYINKIKAELQKKWYETKIR
jgi:hypothetical protein